jgi:integrase
MTAGRELVSTLSDSRTSEFVFSGQKPGRPLSGMAFEMLMRRMEPGPSRFHGFRSAFRDWAGDETSFPREVAEQALAHRVGDATERAYRRADTLERRRKLMEAWAGYCTAPLTGNVVRLSR